MENGKDGMINVGIAEYVALAGIDKLLQMVFKGLMLLNKSGLKVDISFKWSEGEDEPVISVTRYPDGLVMNKSKLNHEA